MKGIILDITILNHRLLANKQIKDIKDFLSLVTNTFRIYGATNKMIKEALEIDNDDLEDNLQYICAKNSSSKVIVSNDKNFYKGNIEALSSKEFIKKFGLKTNQ